MKKRFVLLVALFLINAVGFSQTILFEDNFDSYTPGQFLAVQSNKWTTWSGTAGGSDDGLVVTDRSLSSPYSVLVEGGTDLVLFFGNRTEKKYEIKFHLFIESGYGGYYNLLHRFEAGGQNAEWAMEVYFSNNGTGFLNAGGAQVAAFTYNQNTWIECSNIINLDEDLAQLSIGGNLVHTWQWSLQSGGQPGTNQLAALDLYAGAPSGQTAKYYIDDLSFTALYTIYDHDVASKKVLGGNQFTAGEAYNPGALIKNEGRNTESFNVTCGIFDFKNVLLYSNTQIITALEPDSIIITNFEAYNLPTVNNLYQVIIYTSLPGDMDTSNDTTSKYINTYTTDKKNVVLEIGTGTWCVYCPGAAMGADDLITNGHDVAVLEYHRGDNYSNTFSDARVAYYGITGYPTAIFDGVNYLVGGSNTQSQYSRYLPVYNQRKIIKSAFDLEISGNAISATNYNLKIKIFKLAPALNEDLVLHVVLTESEIPENWQGQTKLNFVERLMLPNANGTTFALETNDTLEVPLTFAKNVNWVSEHCELVAFIQDIPTKEILQAAKVRLNNLSVRVDDENLAVLPTTTELMNNYPNPFNLSTTIRFTLAEPGEVLLDIYNLKGQKVKTLAKAFKNGGEHSVVWNGRDDLQHAVTSGIYIYKLRTGQSTFSKKMLLMK